ncbi:MAG: phosphopantothenoylcysteine decarboxylase [Christensenellaceae bacterium]
MPRPRQISSAKAANGIADDFISTLLLAARGTVLFAPAMNTAMLHHPAVQANWQSWRGRACVCLAGAGMLACGDVGDGRMAEPEEISDAIWSAAFLRKRICRACACWSRPGQPRERLDDVRFLSNRSTGKMGYAVAAAAAARGAEVTLISGPVALPPPFGVRCVSVESAQQMFEACWDAFPGVDIAVKAAAVADYTPSALRLSGKIKKSGDIAAGAAAHTGYFAGARRRKRRQRRCWWGLRRKRQTWNRTPWANMQRKNLDFIAANDISRSDIGFGSEQNLVTLYFADGSKKTLEKAEKRQVAHALLDEAMRIYQARH